MHKPVDKDGIECNQSEVTLRFRLEWRLTGFFLLFFPLLVVLGFWQLDRADQKRALLAESQAQDKLASVSLGSLLPEISSVRSNTRVKFEGFFRPDSYLLLDNRIRDSRFGYEVLALVHSSNLLLPVNLGWIPGDPSRKQLPNIALPENLQIMEGRIYRPTGEPFRLAEPTLPKVLPAVIQHWPIDLGAIHEFSGALIFPYEVRATTPIIEIARRDWPVINQSVSKHIGYAIQWFSMAGALFVAFILASSTLAPWVRFRLKNSHKGG